MAYGKPDFHAYKYVIRTIKLAIAAGTVEGSAVSDTISLDKGEIIRIDIAFPPGSAYLAFIQIKEATNFVCPTTTGEWLGWDNLLLSLPIQYGILADATTITVLGYNDDSTYQHTPVIHFVQLVAR